jgi:hypothetical protein
VGSFGDRLHPDNRWVGGGSSTVTADFPGTAAAARVASTKAIQNLGGQDISLIGSSITTGWMGSMWTNIPQWQAYQLSVVMENEEGNPVHLLCCVRPRKAWAAVLNLSWWYVWGGNRSAQLAQRLSEEIAQLSVA